MADEGIANCVKVPFISLHTAVVSVRDVQHLSHLITDLNYKT
jgi:hypothetical protein